MSNIDLHTHVVPPTIIDAMLRTPSRFNAKGDAGDGVRLEKRDGKLVNVDIASYPMVKDPWKIDNPVKK